jgi:hypothetical protein
MSKGLNPYWPESYPSSVYPIMNILGMEELWGDQPSPPPAPKPLKRCLRKECGKEHTHNNCWCSPECAKMDKERGKK